MFHANNFISKLMFFLGLSIIILTLPGCESLATRSFYYVLELCLGAGAVLFAIGCILLGIGRLIRKFFDTNVNIIYISHISLIYNNIYAGFFSNNTLPIANFTFCYIYFSVIVNFNNTWNIFKPSFKCIFFTF